MNQEIVILRKKNKMIQGLIIVSFLIGILTYLIGYKTAQFNTAIIGVMFLFTANIIYAVQNFRKNFLFLLMQVTIFTFLIGRPFIGMCRGEEWWNSSLQSDVNAWWAITLLMITEGAVLFGAVFSEIFFVRKKEIIQKKEKNRELQFVSMIVFFISILFYLLEQYEPLVMIGYGNYLEYYTDFTSQLPGIIHTLASFMKYSLCLFLATLPSKKKAMFPLILYVFSTVPSLLIGVRNPFILSLVFSLAYFLLRDYLKDEKIWIGKIEKILMFIGTPILLVFMTVYATIRSGGGVKIGNFFQMIVEFFYEQGVTFDVLTIGYGYIEGLKIIRPCNYTFGGIIDYLYRGTIGQKIFHTDPLTSYNSVFNGENSNSLAHVLSYISLKDEYLQGRGRGSSYLLETAVDFGYIGVAVFSVLLGALLIYMVCGFGKKVLLSTIILVCLQNIFFIPRAEATGWLTFIVTIQFWACMAGCYLCAFLCKKWKIMYKLNSKVKRCKK